MRNGDVLVVGETPSLGRALRDLLDSGRIPTRYTEDPAEAVLRSPVAGTLGLVVVACTGLDCETARRWRGLGFPPSALLVVGSRDPERLAAGGVRGVSLPIDPAGFLAMIERLRAGPPARSAPRVGAPGRP